MTDIRSLEPKAVFQSFADLNEVPRCSNQEEQISNWIKAFGEKLGLETIQDHVGNVIIRKPASVGKEALPGVTIQAHMDMVCMKDEDSLHNFSCDPIDMIVEGDWITANKTTLGADDGIGVAMGMALLMDEELSHPALELLVTTTEETGMDGAFGVDPKEITGEMLINIDSEEEGYVTIGCAGGSTGRVKMPLVRVDEAEWEKEVVHSFDIRVDQLRGGHSGVEIHAVTSNAIKALTEVMRKISVHVPIWLHDFTSGDKHNAIPDNATGKISVEESKLEAFLEAYEHIKDEYVELILKQEPDIRFVLKQIEPIKEAPIAQPQAQKLISLLELLPHGVYTMIPNEDIVEASNNLATIRTFKEEAEMILSVRSSRLQRLHELQDRIQSAASVVGGSVSFGEGYPAWEPAEESKLKDLFVEAYREQTGEETIVTVIHAGLECALFKQIKPEMDMVSVGPDVHGAHTTKERLSISSTKRTYDLIKDVIERL